MRTSRRLRAVLAIGTVAAFALLAAPSIVLADCMMPKPVEETMKEAEVVFVGTVTETSNRDTWASVEIDEVWKGPDQPKTVVVKGGPGGNAATSVDRTFEVGTRYLFFPLVDPAGGLADNSCTSTQAWTADLTGIRPAGAHPPTGGSPDAAGFDLGSIVGPLAVALVVAGVLFVAGFLARGRTT